jgi:hypothetical protein
MSRQMLRGVRQRTQQASLAPSATAAKGASSNSTVNAAETSVE